MASDIELIIFDGTTPLAGVPAHASVVALTGVLRAIAVNEALVASLTADGEDCDAIRPGWTLRVCVCRLAQKLSADRRVLYVAAETFGGPGTQEAAAWHEGQTAYGPSGTCDIPTDLVEGYQVAPRADSAINVGLRLMGVHIGDDPDEFAAAGLNAHRFTSEWLIR